MAGWKSRRVGRCDHGVWPLPPLRLDVKVLAWAFRDGGLAFFADIQKDPTRLQLAISRAPSTFCVGELPSQIARLLPCPIKHSYFRLMPPIQLSQKG
jgi:hypothetical protein